MSNLIESLTGGGKKTIAVMGATGAQGGSVVKAFNALGNDNFQLRAITRDPESEKAKAIEPLVHEVVKADGDDEESMVKAFEGCYGAFIVSNFWQDMDAKHEKETLLTCCAAAKKAGLKHVVLSTLEDTRETINASENKDTWKVLNDEGMYVPHFDAKGEVTSAYDEVPVTKLYTCAYMENFIYFGWGPTRQAENQPYGITFPMGDKKMALVSVEDIGKAACAIFQDTSLIGQSVGVMSDVVTGEEMAATFTKICGEKVNYNAVPTEVYASFGFPGCEDLANMFRYYVDYESDFLKSRTIPESVLKTMGGTVKFEDFVTANKDTWKLEPMSAPETSPKAEPKSTAVQGNADACCIIQ